MIKLQSYSSIALALILAASVSLTGSLVASAQTVMEPFMPALYNSAGMEVNTSNTTPLPAGYYYLAPGAQASTQVYYNGDGTYVDQTTGLYGGSVSDSDGTAGQALLYGTRTGITAPGVPNTGRGGEALASWLTLIASGMVAVGGVAYLVTRKRQVTAL